MKINIKKILLIALACSPFYSFAQSGEFILKGKLGNLNAPVKIFLSYHSAEGKNFKDSCELVNGAFELKGYVSNPVNSAQLFVKRYPKDFNNVMPIWVEPGTTVIIGTDSLPTATITGSQLNTDARKLSATLKPFNEQIYGLYKAAGFKSDQDKNTPEYKEYAVKVETVKARIIAAYRHFILSNPNSLVSLNGLMFYGGMKYGNQRGVDDVEPLFNGLSEAVKNSKMGKEYKVNLEKWKAVGIGTYAPNFTLYNQEKKAVKLSDFKGKYVLVDFWASWCHPCRAENPNLVEQYRLFKDKNFTILSVSIDEEKNWNSWIKAIKDDHLTWPQVVGQVANNEARAKFGVQSIPDNFLIDPNGYILDKGLRGDKLNKKLVQVLIENKDSELKNLKK